MGAMRALALSLASELVRRAPTAAAESTGGWGEGSAILLSLVQTMLGASAEASRLKLPAAAAALLPADERDKLSSLVARALLALPDTSLPSTAIATLLLLLTHPSEVYVSIDRQTDIDR